MNEKHERLRQARIDAGFATVKEAADRLGIAYATYASHENGSRGYNANDAKQYAKAFRTKPEWLLLGTRGDRGSISAELTPREWELVELFRRIPEGRQGNAMIALGLGVPDNDATEPEARAAAAASSSESKR